MTEEKDVKIFNVSEFQSRIEKTASMKNWNKIELSKHKKYPSLITGQESKR